MQLVNRTDTVQEHDEAVVIIIRINVATSYADLREHLGNRPCPLFSAVPLFSGKALLLAVFVLPLPQGVEVVLMVSLPP